MPITCLFIDLDDTIYPPSSGIWEMIRMRIDDYLLEKMDFSREKIPSIRQELFQQYGTTLRGLQQVYGVDEKDYLDYVHDIPIEDRIQPDITLHHFFSTLPCNRFIFTNADRNHALRILKAMDMEKDFTGIIDIHSIAPYCKPQVESFQIALQIAGNPNPGNCMIIDDTPRNLETAMQMGMHTVLCCDKNLVHSFDAQIPIITELPSIYQKLINT
jgi:putative hydrolase of the HAD superfamily